MDHLVRGIFPQIPGIIPKAPYEIAILFEAEVPAAAQVIVDDLAAESLMDDETFDMRLATPTIEEQIELSKPSIWGWPMAVAAYECEREYFPGSPAEKVLRTIVDSRSLRAAMRRWLGAAD